MSNQSNEQQNVPILYANVAKRVLTVFFLLDCSASMADDGRIAQLNDAIPTTIESLRSLLDENPNLSIVIKTLSFSSTAKWHIGGREGTDINQFLWKDLQAGGATATASAVNLLCDELETDRMPKRGYPPVCVMISDGYSTEEEEDYDNAIKRLNALPWGCKAARIVIAIGDEHDYDEASLSMFVNDKGSFVKCEESSKIVEYIRLKTTEATISASETGAFNPPTSPASPTSEASEAKTEESSQKSKPTDDPNPDQAW